MFQQKRSYWRNLDNAAKLFSATSSPKDTRVFRFHCVLKENVDQEILQEALNRTIKMYPIFLSVMRKGFFWHYFEKSELRPKVREEYKEACSCLYVRDKKTLLFEVTYYRNRINFEVFHALTDGTGATEFLRELVKNYLYLAHHEDGLSNVILTDENLTVQDQEDDSFTKYYSPDLKKRKKQKIKAYQIKKMRKEYGELRVSEGTVSVKSLLQESRKRGVSMTVLITAVLLCAIHEEMTKIQEKKPVVLMVPVNLRKFFSSDSMLNFFGYIEPGYRFGESEDKFEEVLQKTKDYFKEHLTKEQIAQHMNDLIAFEKNKVLRWAPLELKNRCIWAGAKLAEKEVTAVFSNMSAVNMPEEYKPYIERFGVYTSTPKVELCVCSFEDTLSLGFTSRYDSSNIQRNFYRILAELGVESKIAAPEFPEKVKPNYEGLKFFKCFSFCCIAATVLGVMLNVILTPERYWAIFVAAGVMSMWSSLAIGFVKRHNLLKNAMWQLLVVTIGCVIWDIFTGWHKWSVNYVLPSVCVVIDFSMVIISKLQSHSPREYMIYYVMASGYGMLLPFILLLTGVITVSAPAVICVGFSFLFLMALIIFKKKEFVQEMHKKFHV